MWRYVTPNPSLQSKTRTFNTEGSSSLSVTVTRSVSVEKRQIGGNVDGSYGLLEFQSRLVAPLVQSKGGTSVECDEMIS